MPKIFRVSGILNYHCLHIWLQQFQYDGPLRHILDEPRINLDYELSQLWQQVGTRLSARLAGNCELGRIGRHGWSMLRIWLYHNLQILAKIKSLNLQVLDSNLSLKDQSGNFLILYKFKFKFILFIFFFAPLFFFFILSSINTMDPAANYTPACPDWPFVAPEARAPHSFGLEYLGGIPLTASLDTHIYSWASGEVSLLFLFFKSKLGLG